MLLGWVLAIIHSGLVGECYLIFCGAGLGEATGGERAI